jgi:cytochrome c-type biogenesis protein CcmH/NrfG
LQVYLRPGRAVSDLMDKGSLVFATVVIVLVACAFFFTVNARLDSAYHLPAITDFYPAGVVESEMTDSQRQQAVADYTEAMDTHDKVPVVGDAFFSYSSFDATGFYRPILTISVFFIPLLVYFIALFGNINEYGQILRREYSALITCSFTAWAAAHLPFALAGIILEKTPVDSEIYLGLWLGGSLVFGLFMTFVLRTIFGLTYLSSIGLVLVASLSFSIANLIYQFVPAWVFLPFLAVFVFFHISQRFATKFADFKRSILPKQNYKRLLHQVVINPADAGAHIELAHIYRFRHQQSRALEHFQKALEIDPNEMDANYEFGKIARSRGQLQSALDHFAVVVDQDDTHALNEIWREIAATYLSAGMFSEARKAIETFLERRPFDAEALYYLGKCIKAESGHEKAREVFERAVESVRVSPAYRKRYVQRWGELAQKEI